MKELHSEIIGERRVCLVAQAADYSTVTIAVRGPLGWEDISLRADHSLVFDMASRRERLRVAEQQGRAIQWGEA